MHWIEPVTINDLLDRVARDWLDAPPESNGAYVVSLKKWIGEPSADSESLYVGGNTGNSLRFRTRVGDLLADMFGFYGVETGHHSGGQSLNSYCRKQGLCPKSLYIGWATDCECGRCAEIELYDRLEPPLNKKRPARCRKHG